MTYRTTLASIEPGDLIMIVNKPVDEDDEFINRPLVYISQRSYIAHNGIKTCMFHVIRIICGLDSCDIDLIESDNIVVLMKLCHTIA